MSEISELTKQVAGLIQTVNGMGREIGQLRGSLGDVSRESIKTRECVAGISAKQDAFNQQDREEKKATFRYIDDLNSRVGKVEVEYVPKPVCTERCNAQKAETERVERKVENQEKTIGGLKQTEAKAMTLATVVSIVIGVVSKYVWH